MDFFENIILLKLTLKYTIPVFREKCHKSTVFLDNEPIAWLRRLEEKCRLQYPRKTAILTSQFNRIKVRWIWNIKISKIQRKCFLAWFNFYWFLKTFLSISHSHTIHVGFYATIFGQVQNMHRMNVVRLERKSGFPQPINSSLTNSAPGCPLNFPIWFYSLK